jgi:hypothetical protein
VPFRLRFRASSSDPWISGPEIHFQSKDPQQLRGTIIFKWDDDFETRKDPNSQEGWVAAYQETAFWTANSMFDGGAASAYYKGNAYSTNVRRVQLDGKDCIIHLDSGTISKGPLEVEIIRGLCYDGPTFSKSAYTFGGTSYDPFDYITSGSTAVVFRKQAELAHKAQLARTTAITNTHPIRSGRTGSGLAEIAIRARNREVKQVSCQASGLVSTWNGTTWSESPSASSNPGDHLRDVLMGPLSADPLIPAIFDNASVEEFREACAAAGYTCNLLVEGSPVKEVLDILTSCGYAQMSQAETWGVIRL